jgi:hypothetical protein
MNIISELVYDFLANDDTAYEGYERIADAVADRFNGSELAALIREEFIDIMTANCSVMGFMLRLDEHIEWDDIARKFHEVCAA